jgi:hypothetical protein
VAATIVPYADDAPLGPVESTRNLVIGAVVTLYVVLNAGFMQIRLPPGSGVPLAELALILGLLTINYTAVLGRMATVIGLAPLMIWWGWGGLRLLLDVRGHGMWALRDATQLIESLFLVVGFAMLSREWLVERAFAWLRVTLAIAVLYALTRPYAVDILSWSPTVTTGHGIEVPIVGYYGTSGWVLLVAAAGLLAAYPRSLAMSLLAAALLGYGVLVMQARTFYVSVPVVLAVLVVYRRSLAGHAALALVGTVAAAAAISVIGLGLSGRIGGEIGLAFLRDHALAIFGETSGAHAAAAAAAEGVGLRLHWWLTLYERLTDSVASLLLGLGFGIPLTDKQVMAGVLIREPHNSYISVAARTGLLGLVAWLAMHAALLGAWLRAFRLHRDAGDRVGQNRLVVLLVFFASLWITALAEDGFEKPFNAVPYYLAWGIVLRMAYFAGVTSESAAETAPSAEAGSITSPSWAGATPGGSRDSQSS